MQQASKSAESDFKLITHKQSHIMQ